MSFTYNTSLTGLLAASFGLQRSSHNLANLQTPGFKRLDPIYSSLGENKNRNNQNLGVVVGGIRTNFSPGNYMNSNSATDFAISGQEFFIVRLKNGQLAYTRNGEFHFNKEGFLIDKLSAGLVQGYNEKGNLAPINRFGPKSLMGKKTSLVELAGEFILVEKKEKNEIDPDPRKSNFENIKFSLTNIFDDQGKAHSIELEFKPLGSLSSQQKDWDGLGWELIALSYDEKSIEFINQSLRFSRQEEGALEEDSNQISINLPNNQLVKLNLGSYTTDQDKSVRLNKESSSKTSSSINVFQQDGYQLGEQIDFSFDENGQISYHYDNNQSVSGLYLAIAQFDDPEHTLQTSTDNLFLAKKESNKKIGRANQGGFGSIQSHKLESSNVDSTTEFANIVVLQRMFQACAQLIEIDKQLLEEIRKK